MCFLFFSTVHLAVSSYILITYFADIDKVRARLNGYAISETYARPPVLLYVDVSCLSTSVSLCFIFTLFIVLSEANLVCFL